MVWIVPINIRWRYIRVRMCFCVEKIKDCLVAKKRLKTKMGRFFVNGTTRGFAPFKPHTTKLVRGFVPFKPQGVHPFRTPFGEMTALFVPSFGLPPGLDCVSTKFRLGGYGGVPHFIVLLVIYKYFFLWNCFESILSGNSIFVFFYVVRRSFLAEKEYTNCHCKTHLSE